MFVYFLLGFLSFTCISTFIDMVLVCRKLKEIEEELHQIKYIEVERK